MRDIAVLIWLLAAIGVTLRRPWLGVLALATLSYMNPHAFAWTFMRSFPVYMTLFVVVCFAFVISKDKAPLPRDWRIPAFVCLWVYFLFTTLNAVVPWAAWPKLVEVSKIYLPLFFTLKLIDSREKLYYLIITIAGSFGLIATKGGIWALGTGFAHRVYGPTGTQYGNNNEFAIATIMAIPLLILWRRRAPQRWVQLGLTAAIPLCVASAVSSWSRGALLALGVTGLVILWHSKRKYLIAPILAAALIAAPQFIPDEWFGRMDTIQTYEEDASAMSRIETWIDGIQYAVRHPLTGAGFEGWRYVSMRDWHSSYVEILAEHGFIAFGIWLSLMFGSIWTLTWLPRRTRAVEGMDWVPDYCYMVRASLLAYGAGTAFLGLAYWDIFYHLVFITVLIKQFALRELAQKTAASHRATEDTGHTRQHVDGLHDPATAARS